MNASLGIDNSPFALGFTLDFDPDEGNRFYREDGDAFNVDHRQLPDGANFGDPKYRKSSGKFIRIDQLGGGRRTDRNHTR